MRLNSATRTAVSSICGGWCVDAGDGEILCIPGRAFSGTDKAGESMAVAAVTRGAVVTTAAGGVMARRGVSGEDVKIGSEMFGVTAGVDMGGRGDVGSCAACLLS